LKTTGGSKLKINKLQSLFASASYSGRWSSVKPSCSKTELYVAPQRKSVETKTKMLEHPRSSPPIASCPTRSRTEDHPCLLGRGLDRNRDEIHPVMRVQHTWQQAMLNIIIIIIIMITAAPHV